MLGVVLHAATAAFLEVGLFVLGMLYIFGLIEKLTAGRLVQAIATKRALQPLIGAFLGVLPGCGGAIFVMPLWARGHVSFGAVVATLIGTMGDSSWLIMAKLPKAAALIHGITFVTGVATGYLIDWLGIGRGIRRQAPLRAERPSGAGPDTLSAPSLTLCYAAFWVLAILGAAGALTGTRTWAATIACLGVAIALAMMFISHTSFSDDSEATLADKHRSFGSIAVHTARETAFIVVWVFLGYLVFHTATDLGGVDVGRLAGLPGPLVVLLACLVGFIPGCGPQILTTSLYINGLIPFSALAANAICQDGDALYPLLAYDRKAAFLSKLCNVVPALAVGLFIYLSGF